MNAILVLNEVKASDIQTCEDAKIWLFTLLNQMKYSRSVWEDYVTKEDDQHGLLRVKIYTDRFAYEISVGWNNKDYISCKSQARRQRPGESFFRINELFTGPICKESFNRVILDILSNELINIYRRRDQMSQDIPDSKEETE